MPDFFAANGHVGIASGQLGQFIASMQIKGQQRVGRLADNAFDLQLR